MEAATTLKIAVTKVEAAFGPEASTRPGRIVVLFILSLIFKRDFLSLVGSDSVETGATVHATRSRPRPAGTTLVQFVTFVLNDNRTWTQILPQQGPYRHAKLVLFRDAFTRPAAWRSPPPGHFIAPGMKRFTSTRLLRRTEAALRSTGEFAEAYVWPTKLAITCRSCWALRPRCVGPAAEPSNRQ